MNIDRDEVTRIASLAGLELGAEEFETMAAELSKVLEYVDQLRDLDERASVSREAEVATPMREDLAGESLDRGLVERNAPSWQDGFFVVPRVLSGE